MKGAARQGNARALRALGGLPCPVVPAALVPPPLAAGARVALVTDAGMPGISDPGFRLIRSCIDRDLDVEVLPGPTVVPVALVASGLPTDVKLQIRMADAAG